MRRLREADPLKLTALVLALEYAALITWRCLSTGFVGSESYSNIAGALAQTGVFPTVFRPPVYPIFLSCLMYVFGSAWEGAALLIQALAGTICGLLLVSAARRLSPNGGYAFSTALLYTSNILFHIEVVSKRETALFTLVLILFFYAGLIVKGRERRNSVMALCAALALLTRPSAVVLIPILLYRILDGTRRGRRFTNAAFPLVIFAAAVLPWQIVMWQHLGRLPISSSANSGQTLWKGNNPYLLKVWPHVDIDSLDPFLRERIGVDIATVEGDKRLLTEAVDFIKADPLLAVQRGVYKALLFFSPVPIPLGKAGIVFYGDEPQIKNFAYRNYVQLVLGTLHGMALLGGWFAFVALRWRNRKSAPLAHASLALAALFCALHSITYPETRYRQPFDVTATPLAAVGLVLLVRELAARLRVNAQRRAEAAYLPSPIDPAASPLRKSISADG